MALAIIAVIIGLAVLVWSADTFIDGATSLAVRFNMPSFLIGVVILGIGTSAPELVVSALAAVAGSPDLALGNAYGSNIINITLVLGVTALISPILIRANVIRHDLILLLAVTALAAFQLLDGNLSMTDGIVLIASLIGVLLIQIFLSLRNNTAADVDAPKDINIAKALATLTLGLVLLIVSSRSIVWGAVELATLWGMSELLIGLTIVAIGTSLPELVASVAAARRGEHDMALGNVIGSNLFNTLGVVGVATVISPIKNIAPEILSRDVLMMAGVTLLLFVLAIIAYNRQGEMKRGSGLVLILTFIGYSVWLGTSAV
ncbi:calcium/sodium antiporter [Psychrobacter sanguinis]|uniref:calcium/sodium antiporter n=1 Tax=Psychrobacter sanguinis TaxID=861445 RepID=UPI000A513DFF|nr:calcium/sodium antiporter [Psychrobacter sanguinis]MCC3309367.1 calcium/sodium antiporter [Psychrobacter sanguinis]MCC3345421.1 calcium/sodium antiporter [Psychrobacter sanguinis]MDY3305358.1 calcium/sodium antiporter [Psychrobacter sanguinis]UEC26634.1 calcium/sodium antiporter [Psychrobacter sanguinis]